MSRQTTKGRERFRIDQLEAGSLTAPPCAACMPTASPPVTRHPPFPPKGRPNCWEMKSKLEGLTLSPSLGGLLRGLLAAAAALAPAALVPAALLALLLLLALVFFSPRAGAAVLAVAPAVTPLPPAFVGGANAELPRTPGARVRRRHGGKGGLRASNWAPGLCTRSKTLNRSALAACLSFYTCGLIGFEEVALHSSPLVPRAQPATALIAGAASQHIWLLVLVQRIYVCPPRS